MVVCKACMTNMYVAVDEGEIEKLELIFRMAGTDDERTNPSPWHDSFSLLNIILR